MKRTTKLGLAKRRLLVAKMHRRGLVQEEIADKVGVTQPSVSRDLQWVEDRYRESATREVGIYIGELLASAREMRAVAHAAFLEAPIGQRNPKYLEIAGQADERMARVLKLDQQAPAAPVVTVNNTPSTTIDLSRLTDQQLEAFVVAVGLAPDLSVARPLRGIELSADGLNLVEAQPDGTRVIVERRRAGFTAAPDAEPGPTPGGSPEMAPGGPASDAGGPVAALSGPETARTLPERASRPSEAPTPAPQGGPEAAPGRLAQGEDGQATAEQKCENGGQFARFFEASR